MGIKLQHEHPEQSASWVTVHYDNKIQNLEVDENGTVEVENNLQAQELMESHGQFFKVNEDEELPDYVLHDKNVNEVEKYIRDIEDLDRLKELRKKESEHKDRSTAKDKIDQQISTVNEMQKAEEQADNPDQTEEDQPENQDQSNEDEQNEVSEEDETESDETDE